MMGGKRYFLSSKIVLIEKKKKIDRMSMGYKGCILSKVNCLKIKKGVYLRVIKS